MTSPRRRRLGQHFLIDKGAVARIVDALDVERGDPVLEIGPGRGVLTAPLIERVGRIAAVELDGRLIGPLTRRFPSDRLELIEGDALRLSLEDVLARLGCSPDRRITVVGNLPYSISKPIAQGLVRERRFVRRAVLMFQREVADRLVAQPCSRAYGPLTVLVGQAFDVRALIRVPPRGFRPPPAVHSTVTTWQPLDGSVLDRLEQPLRDCLAACFASRRQTLRNNLRAALGGADSAERMLESLGLDGMLRAEQLPPEAFVRLAGLWPAARDSRPLV